jgi:hypothetical protein
MKQDLKLTDYQIHQVEGIILQLGMKEENLRGCKELYPRDYEKLVESIVTLCQFGLLKLEYKEITVNIA